jgi:hypothetical protein
VFRDDTQAVSTRSEQIEARKWAAIRADDEKRGKRKAYSRRILRNSDRGGSPHSTNLDCDSPQEESSRSVDRLEDETMQSTPVPVAGPVTPGSSFDVSPTNDLPSPNPTVYSTSIGTSDTPLGLPYSPGGSLSSSEIQNSRSPQSNLALPCIPDAWLRDAGSDCIVPPITTLTPVPSSTEQVESTPPTIGREVEDSRLCDNYPSSLPPIFKEVWASLGYGNRSLKYALLALFPIDMKGDTDISQTRSERLEFYSLALQSMARELPETSEITKVAINLSILTAFLLIEMKFGTFDGGVAHYKQGNRLVTQNLSQLASWGIGSRLLCSWMSTRSWYSLQYLPWGKNAQCYNGDLRLSLWRQLPDPADRGRLLLDLMSEIGFLNSRLMLARLVGPNACWPSYRNWSRKLSEIGVQCPPAELYLSGSEEGHLSKLADLRGELDAWHDNLDLDSMPVLSFTSRSAAGHGGAAKSLAYLPVRFRSHQMAMNYLHYAGAQALASPEDINALTGDDLGGEPYRSQWIALILQIIAGLDPAACIREESNQIGLLWVICGILLARSLDLEVLSFVESQLWWLADLCAVPGSTCPPWLLHELLSKIKRERAQGRVFFFMYSDISASQEWSHIWSNPSKRRVMLVGRMVDTGDAFYEVTEITGKQKKPGYNLPL